ncbi:hypothetical protein O9992_19890 [Vibrio lentus]|nr:hypothetical protein [Vibrio lentus]
MNQYTDIGILFLGESHGTTTSKVAIIGAAGLNGLALALSCVNLAY